MLSGTHYWEVEFRKVSNSTHIGFVIGSLESTNKYIDGLENSCVCFSNFNLRFLTFARASEEIVCLQCIGIRGHSGNSVYAKQTQKCFDNLSGRWNVNGTENS